MCPAEQQQCCFPGNIHPLQPEQEPPEKRGSDCRNTQFHALLQSVSCLSATTKIPSPFLSWGSLEQLTIRELFPSAFSKEWSWLRWKPSIMLTVRYVKIKEIVLKLFWNDHDKTTFRSKIKPLSWHWELSATEGLGKAMANTSTPSLSEPSRDKPGWISSSVYRINPKEGKGGKLTVKSGQKRNKNNHERSSPSSRNDWLNKHNLHQPCRIRSQLYVQSFALKTFRAGHELLISRTKEGCCGFLPFYFFSPFKISPASSV